MTHYTTQAFYDRDGTFDPSHTRRAADCKNILSAQHEEQAQYQHHQHHHPKHDFEDIRSRNLTNVSTRYTSSQKKNEAVKIPILNRQLQELTQSEGHT